MALRDTGKIGGSTLRERTQNLAARYATLVTELELTLIRTDAALFGSRPLPDDNTKDEPIDSLEADLTQLEITSNRLENVLKDAQATEGRVRNTGPEMPTEVRRYA